MNVRAFLERLRPVDVLRNAILFGVGRWFLWLILRRLWPDYPMLALDTTATAMVILDPPPVRNWWPRMVLAGILVELIRYGFAQAPHLAR